MRNRHHCISAICARQAGDEFAAVRPTPRFFGIIELEQRANHFGRVQIRCVRERGEKVHLQCRHVLARDHGRHGRRILRLAAQTGNQPAYYFIQSFANFDARLLGPVGDCGCCVIRR